MVNVISRGELYRTHLDEYAEKWKEYFVMRRENGVLEVRMHSQGGPVKWDLRLHRALIPAFQDIHFDPDNECIILTGTGDSFISTFDEQAWTEDGFREPFDFKHGYDVFYVDQTKEPFSLLNMEIPIIAAVNGPLFIHAELALLNDIVLASENTTIKDSHFISGGVPGDGVHTLFRELLGHVRGKYFLYTGQVIEAPEALRLGLVNEVLPADKLLERAWDLAVNLFMKQDRMHRRISRAILIQPWRELFQKELGFGQGFESWAFHSHWNMADPTFDITNLKGQ
jgi:enoyl-CoA hydratase/carnithine racemase